MRRCVSARGQRVTHPFPHCTNRTEIVLAHQFLPCCPEDTNLLHTSNAPVQKWQEKSRGWLFFTRRYLKRTWLAFARSHIVRDHCCPPGSHPKFSTVHNSSKLWHCPRLVDLNPLCTLCNSDRWMIVLLHYLYLLISVHFHRRIFLENNIALHLDPGHH